jgi:hypothetical protein
MPKSPEFPFAFDFLFRIGQPPHFEQLQLDVELTCSVNIKYISLSDQKLHRQAKHPLQFLNAVDDCGHDITFTPILEIS